MPIYLIFGAAAAYIAYQTHKREKAQQEAIDEIQKFIKQEVTDGHS